MFRIGDFARLGHVSVRALRHYDEIGLIVPESVDPVNGYRRYSISQLRDLNRVAALRQLGFALPDIKELLAGIDDTELRERLTARRAELVDTLEREQANLSNVDARLSAIDHERELADDVVIKTVPTRRYVALEAVVPGLGPTPENEAITFPLRVSFRDTVNALLLPLEEMPPLTCFAERDSDEELTVFVGSPAPDELEEIASPMEFIDLPATTVATCVRTGHLRELWPKIVDDVFHWIYVQGYIHAGIGRSFALEWHNRDSDQNTFEVHIPICGPGDSVPDVAPRRVNGTASV